MKVNFVFWQLLVGREDDEPHFVLLSLLKHGKALAPYHSEEKAMEVCQDNPGHPGYSCASHSTTVRIRATLLVSVFDIQQSHLVNISCFELASPDKINYLKKLERKRFRK